MYPHFLLGFEKYSTVIFNEFFYVGQDGWKKIMEIYGTRNFLGLGWGSWYMVGCDPRKAHLRNVYDFHRFYYIYIFIHHNGSENKKSK